MAESSDRSGRKSSPDKGAATKSSLSKIKSGAFSRGFAIARVTLTAGARAATHSVGNLFSSEDEKADRLKSLIYSQIGALTEELGQLKGSLMKVGQMLSMVGEQLLPPEANALLKSLQSQSPPLAWPEIHKVLKRQLGAEKLAELEIEPEPIASASLGQVHRARRKSDGRVLAIKIQYPGVDEAVESDLRTLRRLMSLSKLIPNGPSTDQLFKEVQQMLHQEVDYRRELETTLEFRQLIGSDPRYRVAEPFPEYCSGRVLTTSFEEGVSPDHPDVAALPQERRDRLAEAFLDLYFKELFVWGKMQTDPHFGNYRVRIGKAGEPDQLVLLDFGAVRKFPQSFLSAYHQMVRGGFERDQSVLVHAATRLGFLKEEDEPEYQEKFAGLCFLITEPFFDSRHGKDGGVPVALELFDAEGRYDWGKSDLPKRVLKRGADFAWSVKEKMRTPPREVVFLDRKMGGVFIFVSALKARINARELLARYLGSIS